MPPLSELPMSRESLAGDLLPEICVLPPGPASATAAARLARVECPAFVQRRETRAKSSGLDMTPIVLATGRGSNLYDVDGNRYVDLAAGFGSVLLGHGASSVRRAVEAQGERLVQGLGDLYSADAKIALLERLASFHPGEQPQVLLGQSGADAITAALKTALLATGRPGVLAFEGAYHGLSYAPLAACGYKETFWSPFAEQLNPHVRFAPYPSSAAALGTSLERCEEALRSQHIGAVLVEPVLGRGGCAVPPTGFLKSLGELAHRYGALLIADEIWTGMGRSGALALSIQQGAAVDILCLGKGLGGGLPISACIAPADIMEGWARGGEVVHTSTHAGMPLACAAAIATLDTLRQRQLVTRVRESGDRVLERLEQELRGAPGFVRLRGKGWMIGVELESGALGLRASRALLQRGWIVTTAGASGEVIALTPPLTLPEELFCAFGPALRDVLFHAAP